MPADVGVGFSCIEATLVIVYDFCSATVASGLQPPAFPYDSDPSRQYFRLSESCVERRQRRHSGRALMRRNRRVHTD